MSTRSKPHGLLPSLMLLAIAACDAAPEGGPLAPERLGNLSGNPHVEPELFAPGVISTERNEGRISFTADGSTAYFNSTCPHLCIRVSHRTPEGWTPPVVASFSGTYPDLDPFITADGSRLFFSSIRPVDGAPRGDWDTWMVVRTGAGWSDPIHLGMTVNSLSHELYPALTDDGTLYFASSRPGGKGGWDLYRSRLVGGEYQEAENLPDRSTPSTGSSTRRSRRTAAASSSAPCSARRTWVGRAAPTST